jgi:pSer/pThr/pTyr-binding forkhead associated (FHA) protein
VPSYLEVWKPDGVVLVVLEGDRVTVGNDPSNDVPIPSDRSVSGLHAVLEKYAAGWCIRDVGSANGTYLNGKRLLGEHRIQAGDDVRVGRSRLVLRDQGGPADRTPTEGTQPPPSLTPRERDVLVELCRPVLAGDLFTEPASIRDVARALKISEAAVKQHLLHLYDKFAVYGQATGRRTALANEAVRRGAVTLVDLHREMTD